jgi:23S rRNA (cytidine1920-2'-O)/16S rRNA (cytidine1409-2'-O)-methyltransferase
MGNGRHGRFRRQLHSTASSSDVGRGGVVRDSAVHRCVLVEIMQAAADLGLTLRELMVSPLREPAGSRELLGS